MFGEALFECICVNCYNSGFIGLFFLKGREAERCIGMASSIVGMCSHFNNLASTAIGGASS